MDELILDRRKPISLAKNGRALVVRPLPFRVAMRVGDGDSVSADVMSDMISSSVLYAESGDPAFTQEEILEGDSDMVLKLFQAVQNVTSVEDASKN